jgi:ATP-binding cassette subfamily G (WHITE) protein 2
MFVSLGDRGKTVIFSVHQPRYSIFQMFDSVTLLGEGQTVYHGPAVEAKDYFLSLGQWRFNKAHYDISDRLN